MFFIKLNVLFLLINIVNSSRILAVVPTPAFSHQNAFRNIWKELSRNGHHLTIITTDPMNDPTLDNVREINVNFVYKFLNRSELVKKWSSFINVAEDFLVERSKIFELELQHPEVQNLIKNESEHFDLVMVEYFFPVFFMFKHRFRCPFIGISSMGTLEIVHEIVGNPEHPILYENFVLTFETKNASFVQRLMSTLTYLYLKYFMLFRVFPEHEKIARKYFGKDTPSLLSIAESVDMIFANVNPILYDVRPFVPAFVHIGSGSHLQSEKPLPKDIKDFLDSSKYGVIYVSLGTSMKYAYLPDEIRNIMIRVFSSLSYDILWKSEDMISHSKNIMTAKWLPQQDILRHSNIKLFITQGGLQSIEEAIYNHVPMLGLPLISDQKFNIQKIVSKKLGLQLDSNKLEEKTLNETILEVINNPIYKKNIKIQAELTLDQPMSGVKKAVWWTEYVLRHNGAQHLKGPSYQMPLYQYFLLDIIGFMLLVFLILIIILIKLQRLIYYGVIRIARRKNKTD